MDFVSAAQPDVFEALCDTPPPGVSQPKRVGKSVDRTLTFLDEILAILQQSEQVRCVCVCVCVCMCVCACVCVLLLLFFYI